ncbi:hypothetical protein B0T17DRAFT_543182 [Bombardia bombarda]|uniref:Uncharacterized protein n=1 Tax=Bombardia bombarda TaxID=252184 RepID=A0AA39U6Y8_9PEZI|nr:hypothetical protein B0T17DRAFT_543182 [Bombardia bombarda]
MRKPDSLLAISGCLSPLNVLGWVFAASRFKVGLALGGRVMTLHSLRPAPALWGLSR